MSVHELLVLKRNTGWLGIRKMCPSEATCMLVDCYSV